MTLRQLASRGQLFIPAQAGEARFREIEGRFSAPVTPGEALTTHIWRDTGLAHFVVTADGGRVVVERGLLRFGETR